MATEVQLNLVSIDTMEENPAMPQSNTKSRDLIPRDRIFSEIEIFKLDITE
ncbi:hypothetical protein Cha6605_4852 [Chamaesiphon minutus PCC 6605]|uniref:Uncharacterized protein n=1 Tax=Chamaesiphon minutus (strain ATCC 27169 / PCC 6605) TaxID=1173020 RepID=K9ULU7_CHAP6|nr:hypothetical protein Cha6605_4852 [Chamaesiphon minutus PCC 6605]